MTNDNFNDSMSFRSLGLFFLLTWKDYIETIASSANNRFLSLFRMDSFFSSRIFLANQNLPFIRVFNVAAKSGLMLYMSRFSTKSDERSGILQVLAWHLEINHIPNHRSMSSVCLSYKYIHCSCINQRSSLVIRSREYKFTISLVKK